MNQASRCSPLVRMNSAKFRSSRANSWTTRMPVIVSCRCALMRAILSRTTRNASRTFQRNTIAAPAMTGTTAIAHAASRQFSQKSTTANAAIMTRSASSATSPAENISDADSMSLPSRVTSRPTG